MVYTLIVYNIAAFLYMQSSIKRELTNLTGAWQIFLTFSEEGSAMKVIEAEGLSKNFRVKHKEKGMRGSIRAIFHPQTEEIRAVDSVSFGVEEGEILAFIGPNGAGKSTTIKMLTGILYPDGGRMEVLGIDPVRKRRQLAYQVGTVFGQKEQLWTHLTPYDNFRFFAAIYDLTNNAAEARIAELAEIFEYEKSTENRVISNELRGI